jgi:transcription initiation factor IIE alpha subunit
MQRLGEIQSFKDRSLVLKGADIATQRGWTGVPNFILESNKISVGAKLVYAMLLKYAREMDDCFPGQERLSKDMGSGKRSVVRYIAELESVGLISITRRGQGRPNLYTIYLKASFWKKSVRSRSAKMAFPGVPFLHP